MARTYEELSAEFDFERNVFGGGDSPEADDDRTIIGVCMDGTIIKGKARKNELETGLTYRFYGYWTEHAKYGKQFVFISKTLAIPSGQRGTVAYLQRGPGIGKKRALQIWAKYGSESLAAIRERPEEVSASVAGLTPEKCREAAEYFEKLAGLEAVTIELTDLFGSRGFPRKLTEQVIERWGNQAPRIIRENPYVLLDGFRGVGFVRADQLYLELQLPPDAIDRQGYCIWHALHSDNEGHTWLKQEQCIGHLNKNIAGGEVQAQPAIEWALKNRKIARRVDDNGNSGNGQVWLADYGRAASEKKIASILHRAELVDRSKLQWPDSKKLAEAGATEHQIEQYQLSIQGLIAILAGRPGTGKTWLTAAVIKMLGGRRMAVAAPTGKAAVRVTESLVKAGVSGIKATTIHSLLKWKPDGGFEHCEENPLKLDFLFIDESSMLSTGLMASLLDAVPDNCHVLFVGDPGQLSPVEHGAPLRDMIAAGLPCGTLTEIQRQAATSRIVKACHAIADRGVFEPSPKLDLANGENLLHIEKSSPESQIECLKEILERIRSRGEYDVVRDVQVLVAINKKSLLAREPISKMMQGFLNAGGEQVTGNKYRVNDKIICLKNQQAIVEKAK